MVSAERKGVVGSPDLENLTTNRIVRAFLTVITGIAVGLFGAGALITVPVATKFDDGFQASASSLVSPGGLPVSPGRSIGIFCAPV